jgi:hypothetical protein
MNKNMGKVDKIVRLIVGIVLVGIGIIFKSWWGVIGVIMLATSFVSFCPLYLPFKFSTKKSQT